jgi:hypothetical protein
MSNLYDDNFGHYEENDDPEGTREFYDHIQKTNVKKKCQGCGRMVLIQPHYAYCNSCADKRERGMEY